MTTLDELYNAVRILKRLIPLDDEALQAELNNGFRDVAPENAEKLTPYKWARALLFSINNDSRLLYDRFERPQGRAMIVMRDTSIRLGPGQ